jgi:pyrimidine operon attenuation protein/uracil phosphoribosyltransferase
LRFELTVIALCVIAFDCAEAKRDNGKRKNGKLKTQKGASAPANTASIKPCLAPYWCPMTTTNTTVLDARAVERTLKRMAVEIVELNRGTDDLIVVGIQRRGVQLADRIVKMIEGGEGVAVPQGSLDITLYRDDLQTIGPRPVVGPTYLPWDLDDKHVVIVDDVLYTGRTVRAALDELADFGRPKSISLAVLIDRGGRELPIHADVVGKKVTVADGERVDVMVAELDDRTEVVIVSKSAA